MGEINWNKDEGIKNLLKIGEIDSLKKEDVTSDGDNNCNDVEESNVSIHDDLKENKEERTEKFEEELDKNYKVFCFFSYVARMSEAIGPIKPYVLPV